MRALTVILLTANLALAAWLYRSEEPATPAPVPELPAPPLVLMDELPASPPPAQASDLDTPAAPDDAPAASTLTLTCQALGPFMERDAAERAGRALSGAGLNPEMREVDTSRRLGYWVYIPPVASREAADVYIERLRQAGIRDYYLVADGDNANAISLGVFSSEDAATQHASRLRGLGFEVEIGDRRRTVAAWWLDFVTPAAGSEAAGVVAELVREADETLVLDAQPCR